MKTVDEIIDEYEQAINPDNNELENIVIDAMPVVIDGFVDFYGEECRGEIIEKFSRIKIFCSPISMFSCFFNLMSKINKYLEERYPEEHNMYIHYDMLHLPKVRDGKSIEYIKELDDIEQKLASFYEMSERYYYLERKLKEKVNEEYQGELNKFIKNILIKELNYTEEMIARYNVEEDYVYSTFRCFERDDSNAIIFMIKEASNLGISIPPLKYDSKDCLKWDSADLRLAKEEYIKVFTNPNVKKYLPSKEIVKKILDKEISLETEKQEQVKIELAKQFYGIKSELPNYLGINGMSLIGSECAGLYTPSLIKVNDRIEVGGILSLNKFAVELDTLGALLIHEGNHGVETTVDNNDSTYCFKVGWDIVHVRDSTTHKLIVEYNSRFKSYRPLELLNECINDLITKEILDNIRKQTNNIIFRKFRECLYSNAYFVVEEFYRLYKPEIKASRKNHAMDILYQKIGYENFQALANLMSEVSAELYGGEFNYKRAKQNLENGIINDESKFLKYVIKQREQILEKMQQYSQKIYRTKGM